MAPKRKDETKETYFIQEDDKNDKNDKNDKYIILENTSSDMNAFYRFVVNFFKIVWKIILNFIIGTFKISIIYLGWIVMHYSASHMYTKFCVPETWYGFFISPFLTSTPHCQGLRWIVYNGANTINSMWILIGTWLCSKIIFTTQTDNMGSQM